jgi:hypothetical protein
MLRGGRSVYQPEKALVLTEKRYQIGDLRSNSTDDYISPGLDWYNQYLSNSQPVHLQPHLG